MYPIVPPRPATEATARFGKVSLTSVNRFEDHPWWAASATPITSTADHMPGMNETNALGTMHRPQISSVVFRAALIVQPRLIRCDDSHPPAMLPTSAIR